MVRIQHEIAATREELAATLDELATRLSPANQAKSAAAGARRVFSDAFDPDATVCARRRARIVLGATAAVAVVVTITIVRKARR